MNILRNYERIRDDIARIRPDLKDEALGFMHRSPVAFVVFMSKHFPIPGGWPNVGVGDLHRTFREHYEVSSEEPNERT